jgi:hypothetical protein
MLSDSVEDSSALLEAFRRRTLELGLEVSSYSA